MKYLLIVCGFFVTLICSAQTENNIIFPEDYLGVYKGVLEIESQNGNQSIPMEFHLKATDSVNKFNYTIIYVINDKPSPREYTLIVTNRDKGLYKIDENNGIILDARLVGTTLTSVFEVQDNLLITTERFFNTYMTFDIVFSAKSQSIVTTAENEGINVTSYPITTTQTARLEKK